MADEYNSFAALIYVASVEESAVMRMYDWKEVRFENDDQLYFRAESNGKILIAAKQDEMGMTASATLTMKIVDHFRPKYAIMPGIAAGTLEESKNEQEYGDVVIADMVWNFSNGKYVPKDEASIVFGEVGFKPRPTVVQIDKDLVPYFEKAIHSVKNETYVHMGAIASGSAVVANKAIVERQVKAQFETTKALEMEGYGVAYAASHSIKPHPKAIIVKSVCDFADGRKSDEYQKFAAHTSCEFVKLMIDNILE